MTVADDIASKEDEKFFDEPAPVDTPSAPEGIQLGPPKYNIAFEKVTAPTFIKKDKELLAYEYPLRGIFSGSKWPLRRYNFLRAIGWYRLKFLFVKPKPAPRAEPARTLEDEILAQLAKQRAENIDRAIVGALKDDYDFEKTK